MCLFDFSEWTPDVGVLELHACPGHCSGAGWRWPCGGHVETWKLLRQKSNSGCMVVVLPSYQIWWDMIGVP